MSNKNKKVSIIMPVYNSSLYLDEAIKSIINQTYKNFELIIINDNSSDNSKQIALLYAEKDERIIVIDNKYEKGIHGASNTGIDIASGDFIAKADSDDIQEKNRIEIEVKFLENNKNIDLVGSGYKLFGGSSNNKKIFHPTNSLKIAWKMLSDLYFCNPSTMFRNSVLKNTSHYPKVKCEDFAFLSGIIKKHRGNNIRKILVNYRQHNTNYSNIYKKEIELSVLDIFKENYIYYIGSLEDSEVFYKFHKQNLLNLKDLSKIIKKSTKIIERIVKQYDSNCIIFKYIYMYLLLITDVIKSVFRYYTINIYKKIKNII